VSGVPDIVVTLTGPSGKHNLNTLIELPVFHPCVRLAKWKEQPGVLSFIPPDGRFILAGYEVDLLPFGDAKASRTNAGNLKLPLSLEIKTGLGHAGSDFEVRLNINRVFGMGSSLSGRGSTGGRGLGGGPNPGTPSSPSLQDLIVSVPLPADVRNLSEIRPSKGDANYNPGDRFLEWSIPDKELASGGSYFGLRCTVVRQQMAEEDVESDPTGFGFNTGGKEYAYDENYQSNVSPKGKRGKAAAATADDKDERRAAQNKTLMPSSASVSFAVKGWLASGLKVESILIDPRKSRGLGDTVKPFKGVKYLTVSKSGVEIRC
jgi:AP-3 complex subunit mu